MQQKRRTQTSPLGRLSDGAFSVRFYKSARQCGGPAGYPSGDNVAAGQCFWAGIIHLTARVSTAASLSECEEVYQLTRRIAYSAVLHQRGIFRQL
jgi:hypothetical protein